MSQPSDGARTHHKCTAITAPAAARVNAARRMFQEQEAPDGTKGALGGTLSLGTDTNSGTAAAAHIRIT
jgi:hypothetical protein